MSGTVTIPAGTRVRNMVTGRTEVLWEAVTVEANYRFDDHTWVWMDGGVLFEVKLTPGD
jgi:hypothetical protein